MKKRLLFLSSAWADERVFAPQISKFKTDYQIIQQS